MAKNDLQGALDLLVLKTLFQLGSMHGYGIVMHIRRVSGERIIVEEGSLYPALHRLERRGCIKAKTHNPMTAATVVSRNASAPTQPAYSGTRTTSGRT